MDKIPFQLSDVQVTLFSGIGDLFAVSEVDADQAVEDFARAVEISKEIDGKIVKQADYHLWVAGSEVMKLAYAKKKGLDITMPLTALFETDTVKGMWKRFTRRLEENYALVKPASPSTTGQKKADQRSKAQPMQQAPEAPEMEEEEPEEEETEEMEVETPEATEEVEMETEEPPPATL